MKPATRGFIVVAVLAGAVGVLPIARGPGYEFSLLAGLIVPSAAAITSSVEGSASSPETSLFARALRGVVIGAISAGIALVTSFGWAILGGFCDVVGGVKEKLLAAHRAGIKRVIIPDRNVKDLIDVPDEVKGEMEILSVKRMDEVLALALKDPPASIIDLAKAAQAENHPTA